MPIYFHKWYYCVLFFIIVHTYIHNWPLQPFSQDYWPSFSHHIYCVLILHKWRDLQFIVNSERQIYLRNFSWQFLFTLRVFARNLLRGNRRRNTFRISFWCLAWDSNFGFSSNKPTHYLLDHGDLSFVYGKK